MQLRVPNRVIVIVSDLEMITDLLERRGAVYSERPKFHMADAVGFGWSVAIMPRGKAWRLRRRLVEGHLSPKSTIETWHPLVRQTALELAQSLLATPDKFAAHVRRSGAANIMKAVYGIDVAPEHDPYVDIAEKGMQVSELALTPGRHPFDVFPALRLVPSWVPILGYWTALAERLRKYPEDMLEVPFARTRADMESGRARESMVSAALEQNGDSETEDVVKEAAAAAYLAGADTTQETLMALIMAMVLWPEHQRKAQQELDRVLGERLPDLVDLDALPYLEAVVRETYRCFPIVPLSIPHAASEDDVYRGFLIRKGTVVIPNLWQVLHDEALYPAPNQFDPARWLRDGRIDPDMCDPRTVVFGVGRRICPGRHFADAAVRITAATLLRCFDFGTYVENGAPVPPSGKMKTGLLSYPEPFQCTITPRSSQVKELIEAELRVCKDEV